VTRIKVAVNGYGVIGKRVADAVALQSDMELAGVADVVADYRIKLAADRGYPVFASSDEAVPAIRAAGLELAGTLADLLGEVDVVVDATPKKVGAANREAYAAAGSSPCIRAGSATS
jgi:glyceraldehyde-3-phosphate dehydrogenase (NAD(P))